MTATVQQVPHILISELGLEPAAIALLPSKARRSLIAYLIRWGHQGEAHDCLQAILQAHEPQVSVYDDLARLYLQMGAAQRAQETMRRRQELKRSNSSAALEARTHLAAGDLAAAQAIAQTLAVEAPDMLLTWSLQVDVCLAGADLEGAEAALARGEALQPENVATAQGLARLWATRGDGEKALLWARTAVSRANRDGRQPSVDLLRLLEGLHRSAGQVAQAEAITAELRARQASEWETVRLALDAAPPPAAASTTWTAPHGPPQPAPEPVVVTAEEAGRLLEALRQHFGHAEFRPGQAETIAAVLRGESVLAVMPTGAGKSLCYQLAAMLLPGTTLVISPLIALMKDQLDGLPAGMEQRATAVNSTLDGTELGARLAGAAAGHYSLVYAAPERLRQRPFLHALTRAGVSLLVVDEAHCVSLWGHDFRPDYRFIAQAWQELGRPRILGMTATATPRVQDDVQAALGTMRLVMTGTHRPNLHLEARRLANEAEKKEALAILCHQHEGSGIVYATSRERCEDLAALLRRRGVQAIHYHAGIADRAAAQDRFMSGEARVVVATVAFGMGVDKADVRFIVHYNPPRALENYYQEAGRAGRDGLPARCVLFHTAADWANLTRWARQDTLDLDLLRRTYAAVRARLGGHAHAAGIVTAADLERDLGIDETRVRVAVHFLETAGLVWRGFDLPRTATLALLKEPGTAAGQGEEFARFVEAARLRPGQVLARDLAGMAREAERDASRDAPLAALLDPRQIEGRLLAWAEAGWLEYRGAGRDMLLALPPSPADSRERVAAMVADYHAGQAARIAEMRAYADSRACRHGAISLYFGGQGMEGCKACDNCRGGAARVPSLARPAPPVAQPPAGLQRATPQYTGSVQSGDHTRLMLQAVAQLPYPVGRSGLARALKGAASSTLQAERFPLFGALASRTQKGIMDLADRLLEEGLLAQFEKDGYSLLQLTAGGKAFLASPQEEHPGVTEGKAEAQTAQAQAGAAVRAVLRPVTGGEAEPQTPQTEGEEELFERLRAWRLTRAREMGKPPYVICHDSTLQTIAAARPGSLDELAAIKGMGPRRLELYGDGILRVVGRCVVGK
jgi:ATP-dependent DNA helicase RecQ